MHLKNFNRSWGATLKASAIKDVLIVALLVTNALAVIGWFRSEETVVLVPFTLTESAEVSASTASKSYKEAYALAVAELVGNVTPGNADFVLQRIGDILSPDVYREVKERVSEQIADIKADSLSVSFEPRQVIHEPETDKIFVFGRFKSVGPSGEPRSFMRTYELRVAMRFGRPWVTEFVPYAGNPKTMAYLKSQSRPSGAR